jgi:hypothetical protein
VCELDMPDRSSKMLLLAIRETVLAIVVDYRKDQSENFISIQLSSISRNRFVGHRDLLISLMQI